METYTSFCARLEHKSQYVSEREIYRLKVVEKMPIALLRKSCTSRDI
jgi:hypothetical protein